MTETDEKDRKNDQVLKINLRRFYMGVFLWNRKKTAIYLVFLIPFAYFAVLSWISQGFLQFTWIWLPYMWAFRIAFFCLVEAKLDVRDRIITVAIFTPLAWGVTKFGLYILFSVLGVIPFETS